MSFNQWTGIGYLQEDPETGETESGIPYAKFTLVTVDSWVDDGKRKDQTFFHSVVIWNEHLIEKSVPYLGAGNLVFVQAPFRHRKLPDDSYASEVVIEAEGKLKFLGMNHEAVTDDLKDAPVQILPYLNQWTGIGNVGKDPEFGQSKTGSKVASFSIATSDTKIIDGKRVERTDWHRVVIWNEHILEKVLPYVKKGQQISVQAPLRHRTFTDSSGNERHAVEAVLTYDGKIRLLGGRRGGDQSGPAHYPMASGPNDGANLRERDRDAPPNREDGDPGPGYDDYESDDGLPF